MKSQLNETSIVGMSAEQIWSIMDSYVRTNDGQSDLKKYEESSIHLAQLAQKVPSSKKGVLMNLSQAANAARDEKRWILLGDRAKVKKANENKWAFLTKAKG